MTGVNSGDERRLLTDDDRQFLRGEKDITEGSAGNAKTRIRTRLRCGLEDFAIASKGLEMGDYDVLIEGLEKPDHIQGDQPQEVAEDLSFYNDVVNSLTLLYLITDRSQLEVDSVLKEAIHRAYPFSEIEVNIKVTPPNEYDPKQTIEKIQSGNVPDVEELGKMVLYGDINTPVNYGEETKPAREWVAKFAERRAIVPDIDLLGEDSDHPGHD